MEGNTTKKQKRLTVSELRNFKGLTNLSDEDAESAISTLEKFSLLMFEMYKKDKALKEKLKKKENALEELKEEITEEEKEE
jgi:hypothetical protein